LARPVPRDARRCERSHDREDRIRATSIPAQVSLLVEGCDSVIDTNHTDALLAAVARIEQRQTAYEQVVHQVLDILDVHKEKLDAILAAATREPGPSPVLAVLADILTSLREQESLLADLPGALAETIRDEWSREPDVNSEPDADDPATRPAWPVHLGDRTGERR
jgi:hypothetical protein